MTKANHTLDQIKRIHQQGLLTEAKAAYLNYLQAHPDNEDVLHALGLISAQEQDYQQAARYLTRLISVAPQNVGAKLHLANVYKAEGKLDCALEVLHALIAASPDCAPAFNNLGVVYFALNDYNDAVSAYRQAIDLRPDFADAYYNLGLCLLRLQKDDDAVLAFKALTQLSPNHPGAHFQLGCVLMKREQFQEAIRKFSEIVANYPNHFESYVNLATCYLRLGQLVDACNMYLKAYAIQPDDKQTLFNLGVIYMRQGYSNDAINYYQKALACDPDYFDVHNNLGATYLLKLDYPNAILHFKEALRLQPDNEALKHTIRVLSQDKSLSASAPAYIQSLFDSYAEYYDAHLRKDLKYSVPEKLLAALKKQETLHATDMSILDLGCGTGLCGELFKPYAARLIGVDLSQNMIKVAEGKQLYDELILQDVTDYLKTCNYQYDLILAGDVLVYFGDLSNVVAAAAHCLRPGGLMAFNVEMHPGEDYKLTLSGRFAHKKSYLSHIADENGLVIKSIEPIELRRQRDQAVPGYLCLWQK